MSSEPAIGDAVFDQTVPLDRPEVSDSSLECRELPVELATDVFAAGVNGALRRTPPVDASLEQLIERVGIQPAWKPQRPHLVTFRLLFPEGAIFLPPKPPKPQPDEKLPDTRTSDDGSYRTVAAASGPHALEAAAGRALAPGPTVLLAAAAARDLARRPRVGDALRAVRVSVRRHRLAFLAEFGPARRRNGARQNDAGDHGHPAVDAQRTSAAGAVDLPQAADPKLAARVQAVGGGAAGHSARGGREPAEDAVDDARHQRIDRQL